MNDASVKSVHWEDDGEHTTAAETPPDPGRQSLALVIVPIVLLLIVGSLLIAGRDAARDIAEQRPPPSSETVPASTLPPVTTTTLPSAPGTRSIAQFDGQVLGVNVGTSVVSTDFDGRLFALDLDTGILTRSQVRTGNFVTVGGNLVVQTGCGSWQVLQVPSFALGRELTSCSSPFAPIDRLGGQASIFAATGSERSEEILVDDGEGGLRQIRLEDDLRSSIVAASDGRVLIERDDELAWVDPATNTTETYATGKLLAAGSNALIWADSCEPDVRCLVWFGSPEDPELFQIPVTPFDLGQPVRLNPEGTRAVFFKSDGILRIVALETGHAREVENPGISASSATWSPDGLWLLEPSGTQIVALNILLGRVTEFQGIPGDFTPGWVALPVTG